MSDQESSASGSGVLTQRGAPEEPTVTIPKVKLRETDSVHIDKGLLFLFSFVIVGVAVAHHAFDAHFDFGVFYYAAHMVREGARHSLYDLAVQRAFQLQYHRPGSLLFCYPPFVLLPFLGLAELPIDEAFVIWTIISVALLYLSVRTLVRYTGLQYGNWPILFALTFMPVASCLGHGQLSILVLSAYVLTHSLWRQGRMFLGGAALAIVDFKFQLVLGFVAVLVLKRKWRELLGFATGSLVFVALSVLLTDVPTIFRYPVFLGSGGGDAGSEPDKMACWRGLAWLMGTDNAVFIVCLSALTILFAARVWRDLDTGFSASLLAAMLVSYHFGPHDLSLFLIPAALGVQMGIPRGEPLPLALSALLIPEIVSATGGHYAVLAVPVALYLWWIGHQRADGDAAAIPVLS